MATHTAEPSTAEQFTPEQRLSLEHDPWLGAVNASPKSPPPDIAVDFTHEVGFFSQLELKPKDQIYQPQSQAQEPTDQNVGFFGDYYEDYN